MSISYLEFITRALLLLEPDLLGPRETPCESLSDTISRRLTPYGFNDIEIINLVAERNSRLSRDFFKELSFFSKTMLVIEQGRCYLNDSRVSRTLSRIIDSDILISSQQMDKAGKKLFDWPMITSIRKERIDDVFFPSVVDTHVHLGGALPPFYYWIQLMLQSLSISEKGFENESNFKTWSSYISRASILRLQIAARIWLRNKNKGRKTNLGIITDEFNDPYILDMILEDLPLHESGSRAQLIFKTLSERLWSSDNSCLDDFLGDKRQENLPHAMYAKGERRLISLAFELNEDTYLENDENSIFRRDLEAYLRIRLSFHWHILHGSELEGLYNFLKVYRKRRRFPSSSSREKNKFKLIKEQEKSNIYHVLSEHMGRFYENNMGVDALKKGMELRVSFSEKEYALHQLEGWIDGIRLFLKNHNVNVDKNSFPLLAGLVFNLGKNVDPQKSEDKSLYLSRFLVDLLIKNPSYRKYIIGVDAAGPERNTSPRSLQKAYKLLQDSFSEELESTPRLGFTYHVGEDYSDLLTGLRNIEEAAEILLPSWGGRLGNAIALGQDPNIFYRDKWRSIHTPVGIHILDILWALSSFKALGENAKIEWAMKLVTKFLSVKKIDSALNYFSYDHSHACLTESEFLRQLGFEASDIGHIISVDIDENYISSAALLQKKLLLKLSGMNITIEYAPSSNLLIGGFPDYESLPYWKVVEHNLPVSINTDDPGIFMTNISSEYSLLYRAMLNKGFSRKDTLKWLERRAKDAKISSFLSSKWGDEIRKDVSEKRPLKSKGKSNLTCDVLLVTATTIETKAVLEFARVRGAQINKQFGTTKTYFHLGTFGDASICLVRSEMGSGTRGGSILTVRDSIEDLKPNSIIMVGIAFGVDNTKQPIGHILVSHQLQDYDLQKIGTHSEKSKVIPRGDKVTSSDMLIDRFRTSSYEWNGSDIEFCLMLSGEKLVDNLDYRDQLQSLWPEAGGGEMEGKGLYVAAGNTDWIIVKAVCDWADGNKRKNKKENQKLAAKNAVEYVFFTIDQGGFKKC